MVKLNAQCSTVLQKELPPKEKDPGSFVLPCIIGNTTVSNALTHLGASISVMPFSMFKLLGLGIPRPVNMIDFVILDIVKDNKVPIILGRPMLASPHARIDVFGGKILLEVGKEQVIFNANERATPVTISAGAHARIDWMRSIISMVSLSPEGFMPSILLLVVVIVTVIMVVVVVAINEVVIVVMIIGVEFVVMIIGSLRFRGGKISFDTSSQMVKFVFYLLDLSQRTILLYQKLLEFNPAYASRAAATWNEIFLKSKISRDRHGEYEMSDPIGGLVFLGGDVVDLIGDKDPTDEDGDNGIGDLTGVSVSLGGEIFSKEKKSRESNIGGSDNTGDKDKITGRAIIAWGGRVTSYACMIYESLWYAELGSEVKRYLVKSLEESGEMFLGKAGK
uniref:Reverse transcriptase domain-containing protein n=1 Tax=Tanacetum cinerariifolium TaxID=118510 RepID=A0A6L2KRZ4_TANCI|nr:hypothetical protein [Tanacetum cinerariifolium]